jgi:uncharacterized protein
MGSQGKSTRGFALVTGGSSGIGLELAKCLAERDFGIILASNNDAKLAEAKAEFGETAEVRTVVVDLSNSEGPQRLYDQVAELDVDVEILVNNAGVGVWGSFKTTSLEDEISMIELNATAPVALTKLFLPDLIEREKGRILFTASQASVGPLALAAVYGATKAFVYSFALALREELKESRVTVTALLPGATDTDWFARAGAGHTETAEGNLADPAEVARAGVAALLSGDDHVVAPFGVKAQVAVSKLLPDAQKVVRLS